jgi:hypothetical protein
MNNLEGGYEERLRKSLQVVLQGWCTPCGCLWGWLKFAVVPTQNFTLEYIIASGYFADFFSGCCVLSRCSRLEVFNKVMRASWTLNFLWSLKYLAFRKWRQVVHHWWTGAHHVCANREIWGQLEFPRVLRLNFPLTKIISICPTFSPFITPIGKLQIQDNTWVGKVYKGFLLIFNWADLSNYVSKGITNLNVIMGLKSDLIKQWNKIHV